MDKGEANPTRRAGELEGFAVGAPPELAAVGVGLVVLATLTGDASTLCRGAVAVAIHTDCSCNTWLHIATRCNTWLHIATHGYSLQHIASLFVCVFILFSHSHRLPLQHIATLQHMATHGYTLQHIVSLFVCVFILFSHSHRLPLQHIATLQHMAAHCKTWLHTATQCYILQHIASFFFSFFSILFSQSHINNYCIANLLFF